MSNVDKDEMPLGPGPGSDSDEDFLGEEPAPAPAPPKADMKSKLLELANRKRREQARRGPARRRRPHLWRLPLITVPTCLSYAGGGGARKGEIQAQEAGGVGGRAAG